MSLRATSTRKATTAEPTQPTAIGTNVARGREAPHAPVDAECDEEDVPGGEQDRKRGEEDGALELAPETSDHEDVRREEGCADDDEVDDDLDEAAWLEHERLPQRDLRGRVASARAFLEVAQEAAELHEQDEGEEDAEGGEATVVQHVVREGGRADRAATSARSRTAFASESP